MIVSAIPNELRTSSATTTTTTEDESKQQLQHEHRQTVNVISSEIFNASVLFVAFRRHCKSCAKWFQSAATEERGGVATTAAT